MRGVTYKGMLIGFVLGLILAHLYHTKTRGPGTVRSKSSSS